MKLVEICKEKRSYGNYIRYLQKTGRLKVYMSKNGNVAYDADEEKERKKHARRGRPFKREE